MSLFNHSILTESNSKDKLSIFKSSFPIRVKEQSKLLKLQRSILTINNLKVRLQDLKVCGTAQSRWITSLASLPDQVTSSLKNRSPRRRNRKKSKRSRKFGMICWSQTQSLTSIPDFIATILVPNPKNLSLRSKSLRRKNKHAMLKRPKRQMPKENSKRYKNKMSSTRNSLR
jgi:hypothetical protein